jgi:hypothetical protein
MMLRTDTRPKRAKCQSGELRSQKCLSKHVREDRESGTPMFGRKKFLVSREEQDNLLHFVTQ